MTQKTDHNALMARFAKGEADAARALTLALSPIAFRHALRLTGDTQIAEDIAQDALIKLWKAAPTWDPQKAKVTTWLYTVTRNLCIDHLRKHHPTLDIDDTPITHTLTTTQTDPILKLSLEKALLRLPLRQREAVVLRHIEGLSNPEIATILNTSIQATESLLSRGRATLKDILNP